MTKKYRLVLVKHLQRVDPKTDRQSAEITRHDHQVELARALEARVRLRGQLLSHGG